GRRAGQGRQGRQATRQAQGLTARHDPTHRPDDAMTSRLALLLLVLLPLAACKNDAPAPVDSAQPAAQQATTADAASKAAAEAAIKAAEEAAAKAPPPVAGTDYAEIPNG